MRKTLRSDQRIMAQCTKMHEYISIIQHHTKCSLCNVKENKSGLKDKQKILHNHYMLTTIKKFKHGITNY